MSSEGEILKQLIAEDFGIAGNGRWFRSDVHSSLVLDYERGIFYLNSRGIAGGPVDYLTKVRQLEFTAAKDFLRQRGYSDTIVYTIGKGETEDVIVYPKLVDAFIENSREHPKGREYWYTRKLTDTTIDRFQLGFYDSWYTIPIIYNGSLRQIQMRRDLPKKEVMRWYKHVPPLLFNDSILKFTDIVYVTEGPNDLFANEQNSLPTVCCDTGAETWLDEWYFYFIRCKQIYLLFDNDKAGDMGSINIARKLGEFRTKIYNFWEFDKGFSPAYFFREGGTREELLQLIETKSKFVFELEKKSERKFRKTKG